MADAGPEDAGREDAGGCAPATNDPSAIGSSCSPGGPSCPPPYVCDPFNGIIVTYSCQLPCAFDCDCPTGTRCTDVCDKGGCERFCHPIL